MNEEELAAGLDAAVAVLVERLDAGVAAYAALVVAAADAVAASATLQAGDPVLLLRLTEATDSLVCTVPLAATISPT